MNTTSQPTASSAPEAAARRPIVLFDGACALCRSLAEWGRGRASEVLEFVSWQDFREGAEAASLLGPQVVDQPADTLRVLRDGRLLAGEDAWAVIIEAHPDLRSFQWVAERLGLVKAAAKAMMAGGHVARRFCRPCRGR